MRLHPQIIEKDGRKEFVVLPFEEFLTLQALLEDYQDLMDLREAKAASRDEKTVPLLSIRDELLRD